jgi:hypothetical protein
MSPLMPCDAKGTTAAEQDRPKQVITGVAQRLPAEIPLIRGNFSPLALSDQEC